MCSGGIVGLGEDTQDRIGLLHELGDFTVTPRICANQYVSSD